MLPIKIAYCFLHMETAKSSKDTEVKVLKKKNHLFGVSSLFSPPKYLTYCH